VTAPPHSFGQYSCERRRGPSTVFTLGSTLALPKVALSTSRTLQTGPALGSIIPIYEKVDASVTEEIRSEPPPTRTYAGKRRAVMLLLEDEEWSKWSDHEIARKCSVDYRLLDMRSRMFSPGCGRACPMKCLRRTPRRPNHRAMGLL
jgi:hypothetical protein